LHVKPIDAWVYHYGWVKPPELQQAKQKYFPGLYNEKHSEEKFTESSFDYSQIDSLALFDGDHPAVMKKRIEAKNWVFNFDPTQKNFDLKTRVLNAFEKLTNYRIGEYKNYKILK